MREFDWETFPETAEQIRDAITDHVAEQNERDRRRNCPRCNPTARAMERVRDQWTVAGIDP